MVYGNWCQRSARTASRRCAAARRNCSARRCGCAKARRSSKSSSGCAPCRKAGAAGSDRDLDALAELLRGLPVESAVPIARAFSHFLTLANIAEQHHRVRRRRAYLRDPEAAPQRGSSEETFTRLLARGVTPDALHAATSSLSVELVLTAHPTAITRRTLIQKHLRIADALARQDRVDLTVPERAEIVAVACAVRCSRRGKRTRFEPGARRLSTKPSPGCSSSSRRCGMPCRASCGRSTAR